MTELSSETSLRHGILILLKALQLGNPTKSKFHTESLTKWQAVWMNE